MTPNIKKKKLIRSLRKLLHRLDAWLAELARKTDDGRRSAGAVKEWETRRSRHLGAPLPMENNPLIKHDAD